MSQQPAPIAAGPRPRDPGQPRQPDRRGRRDPGRRHPRPRRGPLGGQHRHLRGGRAPRRRQEALPRQGRHQGRRQRQRRAGQGRRRPRPGRPGRARPRDDRRRRHREQGEARRQRDPRRQPGRRQGRRRRRTACRSTATSAAPTPGSCPCRWPTSSTAASTPTTRSTSRNSWSCPSGPRRFSEGIRMVAEVFHNLKAVLKKAGHNTTVGDEGGFAPNLDNEEAIKFILDAVDKAGYKAGRDKDIAIALDCACSELFDEGGKKGYKFWKSAPDKIFSQPADDRAVRLLGRQVPDRLDRGPARPGRLGRLRGADQGPRRQGPDRRRRLLRHQHRAPREGDRRGLHATAS